MKESRVVLSEGIGIETLASQTGQDLGYSNLHPIQVQNAPFGPIPVFTDLPSSASPRVSVL